jgi:hypothetical protein
MDIQLGYWRWKIYRWNEHPNPFRGRSDLALEWLRRFQNDRMVMSELRATLTAAAGSNAQRWADDNRVLQEVAARLSSGEFYVCAESSYPINTPIAAVTPPDAAPVEVPPPPPPPSPAPKPPPEPEPSLSPDADAAQIAAVLQQAAQEGTPFCEECARLAAQAQPQPAKLPPPPPPETTLPDAADPVAIAQSLQAAAQNGTPLCVECERLRLAQGQN